MSLTSSAVTIAKPATKAVEFVRVSKETPDKLCLSVEGLPKVGKTEFCLSAPTSERNGLAGLCVHNFDFGLEGVVEKHADREIYSFDYQLPYTSRLPGSGFTSLSDAGAKIWETFVTNFRASLDAMRTVVVDTGGEAWNLIRLARLGKLTQVLPVQYTAVNAEFRQLIQLALTSKANVLWIHRLKDEYKNDQKTGGHTVAGFGDIEYDVQGSLRLSRDVSKVGVDQFATTIRDSRANLHSMGKILNGKDSNFINVARTIYPNSKEEDWK